MNNDKIIPKSLEIELTWACNENCIHCYLKHSKPPIVMVDETISNLLEEIKNYKIERILLTGGEVFLNPNLFEVIEKIDSPDLNLKIFSNLTICSKEDMNRLKDYNIRLIQTSLYSMNPETHDYITGVRGSFQKTLSAIKYLDNIGIKVEVSYPLLTLNYKNVFNVIKYSDSLNIKTGVDFFIHGEIGEKKSNLNYRLNHNQLRELYELNKREYSDYLYLWGEQTMMKSANTSEINFFNSQSLSIKPDGTVTPMIGIDIELGNINNNSLVDIANSEKALMLNKITMNDFKECRECNAILHCSPCFNSHYNENGNRLDKLNTNFCEFIKLKKELYDSYIKYYE